MEKIKVTFLGTGSAIPTAKRNHPAVLLQYGGENVLVDCGEGVQRQFRIAKLNPCKITKILITHWHADHVLGLPGLFQTLALNGYNKILKVYGPVGTKKMMELYIQLFAHKGKKFPIEVREVSGKFVDEKDFFIEAMEMKHDAPCLAYSFNVKERARLDKKKLGKLKLGNSRLMGDLVKGKVVEIDGKKIDGKKLIYSEKGRKVVFIMDTLYNEDAVKFARDADLLVCEATYSSDEEDLAREYLHLTTRQAGMIAKKAKVKKVFLTHFSQRHGGNAKKILGELKMGNVGVAEDFDSIVV